MPSAEEFISKTPTIGAQKSKSNLHRILYKKWIEIGSKVKTTIVTSLVRTQCVRTSIKDQTALRSNISYHMQCMNANEKNNKIKSYNFACRPTSSSVFLVFFPVLIHIGSLQECNNCLLWLSLRVIHNGLYVGFHQIHQECNCRSKLCHKFTAGRLSFLPLSSSYLANEDSWLKYTTKFVVYLIATTWNKYLFQRGCIQLVFGHFSTASYW